MTIAFGMVAKAEQRSRCGNTSSATTAGGETRNCHYGRRSEMRQARKRADVDPCWSPSCFPWTTVTKLWWTSLWLLKSESSHPYEWRYGAGANGDSGAGSGGSGLISSLFFSGLAYVLVFHLSVGMKGSGGELRHLSGLPRGGGDIGFCHTLIRVHTVWINQTNKQGIDLECLNSLRFDNTRYKNISSEHQGTLEWLWSHTEYRQWLNSDTSQLLYIQGKPGSGKSTLARYFKDHLLERETAVRSALIASFFYSLWECESQKSHYNMLRSILYDILNQDESFFYHYQSEHRKYQHLSQQTHHVDHTMLHYESLQRILSAIGTHQQWFQ